MTRSKEAGDKLVGSYACGSCLADGRSFARVYDTLYAHDPVFLQVQLAFLRGVFGPGPAELLDLGCGTGTHLVALNRAGYSVTGIDADPLMLRQARRKVPGARLTLGDLRRLPFRHAFQGVLCLESPLAYLLEDASLTAALVSARKVLSDKSRIVIDVYDYPAVLGTQPVGPQETRFETSEQRVTVRESHRYEAESKVWTMRQEFEVVEAGEAGAFEVEHRLRIRSMNEYTQALERVGFTVLDSMRAYPGTPEALRHERRVIVVARR